MERNRSTEAVLDATRDLDRRSAAEILAAIHAEDANAFSAVGEVLPQVEKAVDVLSCTLGGGGRWFNVGAGTSGRMGALDSAELPPTFGIEPSRVQAIVAGGARATLWLRSLRAVTRRSCSVASERRTPPELGESRSPAIGIHPLPKPPRSRSLRIRVLR